MNQDETSVGSSIIASVTAAPGEVQAEPRIAQIDPLSVTSLYLKVYSHAGQEQHLSNATGFVVAWRGKHYLVTNWHVLAGRHPETGKPLHKMAALPDEVRIAHNMRSDPGELGKWTFIREPLLKPDGSPRWVEHPLGEKVDVAVLELVATPVNAILHPLDLSLERTDLQLYPSMPVSVIGFPGGLRPNVFFAVWKTGHIASDPQIPYQGLPAFLIDATTRGGMSGSIVVARTPGNVVVSTIRGPMLAAPPRTKFLGIYASRLPMDVEIGCVWRPDAILDVLRHAGGQERAAQGVPDATGG